MKAGSVIDFTSLARKSRAGSNAKIDKVIEQSVNNPTILVRRCSQQFHITKDSFQRILTKDLSLHDNKIQITQEPKTVYHGVVDFQMDYRSQYNKCPILK